MTKTKSTEVTTVDASRLAALREKSGVSDRSDATWPSALTVNRSPLSKDDKTLPMGKFTLKVGEQQVFLDQADVLVLAKGTQFRRWKDGREYIGCTMIEQPGKAEYRDTLGTTKLGKIPGDYETLTKEQQDFNKEIGFHFMVIGVVDISQATLADGTKLHKGTEAVWHPVKLDYKGKKAVTKQDELKKLKKANEATFDFVTHLTKPHRDGEAAGVPFYDYHFERGDDTVFTEEVLASIEAAHELIENENRRIYKLHLNAQAGTVEDNNEVSSLDLNDGDDE